MGVAQRSLLVPLRKDDAVLGVIGVYRQEVRPFSDKQIALLQNFAAQAVIAMENARLITETREALEQQTATAEVLQVINSSPGDLTPVFDAILEKALGLCEAKFGNITTYDGEAFHFAAAAGYPEFAEFLSREAVRPSPVTGWGRIAAGEQFVHIVDLAAEQAYKDREPLRVATVELGGARTCIFVPLVKDNAILGVLTAYRQEVRPFTDKQIALLQSFTAQAVIAMENARLLAPRPARPWSSRPRPPRCCRSSIPRPAISRRCSTQCSTRRCGFARQSSGTLLTYDGERFTWPRHAASRIFVDVPTPETDCAWPRTTSITGRIVGGRRIVHIAGYGRATDEYRDEAERARNRRSRRRCARCLPSPLRKEDALLGVIVRLPPGGRPFTERQIALVQNFAAQAVIAMENARLLTETREALEQQTATAEVLQVINSSPGDLAPVFDAMLEKAMRLCDGGNRAFCGRIDGERVTSRRVAQHAVGNCRAACVGRARGPGRAPMVQRVIAGEHFVPRSDVGRARRRIARGEVAAAPHVDLRPVHGLSSAVANAQGRHAARRTHCLFAKEVRPFTDKQIALLQNFAAQAVIAMENARLLTETREALEQQTATAEVLQVINSSPGDLDPVFEAILEKAHSLCGAELGSLFTYDGERFWPVAAQGPPDSSTS